MSQTAVVKRRSVEYSTVAAFRADAEKLAAGQYETVGNWSFGQILLHLANAVNGSFDGYPFSLPWYMRIVRPFVVPFVKKSFLTQPMKPGFKLPKSAEQYLPQPDVTTEEALSQLQATLNRFEKESPEAEHPFLGTLTPKEWVALHLRHAELHMSFVRPA